jgi:cyclic pyranopterin monophosphate synthase
MSKRKLSHLNDQGLPSMVDISAKQTSVRVARARADVSFPVAIAKQLRDQEMRVVKGGVVETAILAGTQAVKRCSEWILLCHPLPIDACRFDIQWQSKTVLRIECEVKTTHKTGIEMEALTGVSAAALNIYDMCKALSHDIVIGPVQLLEKTGGKSDVSISKQKRAKR